jgi:hypothetical protein
VIAAKGIECIRVAQAIDASEGVSNEKTSFYSSPHLLLRVGWGRFDR